MPQTEVAIVGHNNTKAQVSGKNALLVEEINSSNRIANTSWNIIRITGVYVVDTSNLISISIANVGNNNAAFNGEIFKIGEILDLDLQEKTLLSPINLDATGTELLISILTRI
jgi:hypothetical protein